MERQVNDQILNIKTDDNQRETDDSLHYHPYEATPYEALERLFQIYLLTETDRFVDFGCGKGRLSFLVNYLFDATAVGVERNESFYQDAVQNRKNYVKKFHRDEEKLPFSLSLAEEYPIHPLDNKFYFFNPFSIQIFITVLNNILESFEKSERNIELILYYGSQEYFYYLEDYTPFELINVIQLEEESGNPFERFLIYRLAVF